MVSTIQEVRQLFTQDLLDMLQFVQEGNNVVIQPRQYLGSETFAKIASIVRIAGGEYLSAGKASHFRIPLGISQQQQQQKETFEPKVYRKEKVVVMRISKGVMVCTTYWKDKNVLLHTIQKMQRGNDGKVILDHNQKPLWVKTTTRIPMLLAQQYVMELSKLINDFTTKNDVPQRG